MDFDKILGHIGEFGNYQRGIYLISCLAAILVAAHMLANVFIMATPKHRCFIQGCDTSGSSYVEPWLPFAVPMANDPHTLSFSHCQMFSTNSSLNVTSCSSSRFLNETRISCRDWVWDTTEFESTTVTSWDMVCDDNWKVSFSESFFMLGVLIGSVLFGTISDRYGRRIVFFIVPSLLFLSSVGTSFSSNWIMYTILKIITAAACNGVFTTGFVLVVEFIGPSKRAWCGNIFQLIFAVGELLLAGLAFYFRNWRQLQLAISLPTAFILFFPFVVPESVRWQISNKKFDGAKKTIMKISHWNKRPVPQYVIEALTDDNDVRKEEIVNAGFMQLLRSPVLLRRSLNIFFNWFVNSLVYYGLSMSASNLGGDTYLNFVLLSVVEIPAILVATFMQQWKGRKIVLCFVMVMGGAACIISACIPTDLNWLATAFAVIGKSNIAASFAVIYIYSAEVMPTPLRNTGIGISSMCSRIGGILAPVVAELGTTYKIVPMLIFGVSSAIAGLLALLLPETHNQKLPETIAEAERFGCRRTGEDSVLLLANADEDGGSYET